MVPNARFLELLADIEPSPTTKQNASSGHDAARNHLRAQAKFKDRYVTSFLSGSYARDTSIRPTATIDGKERPDVDIIVVTNYTEQDRPDTVLNDVVRALQDGGNGYEVERLNKRSVRIEPWQAEMDIVPVIAIPGGGYFIADREAGTWQFTNPPLHTTWSSQQNQRFDGRFKPLVKLFKWWRRENPLAGKRPKGFVLEVLTAMYTPVGEAHYGEAFAKMLENIRDAYHLQASIGCRPIIQDPAVPGNDILAKVSAPQWKEFMEKIRVYAEIARRAQDATNYEDATRQWQRVFGNRFRQSNTPAKSASASSFAKAVAPAGTYEFPDKPANPSTARGFA
jgi:hypothetical protein